MGTWGYGPLEGDAAQDVYQEFMSLYDAGAEPLCAKEELHRLWGADITSSSDHLSFLAAMALALWECGVIADAEITELEKALDDRQLCEDPQEEAIYRKATDKFLRKLRSPPGRIRQRRKPKPPRAPLLNVGDCISYAVGDGKFGGAVTTTLNTIEGRTNTYRLVPICYAGSSPPVHQDFEGRNWIIEDLSRKRKEEASRMWTSARVEDWFDRPYHLWIQHQELKKAFGKSFSVICNIAIGPLDPTDSVTPEARAEVQGYHWGGATSGCFESLLEISRRLR